MSYLRWTAAVVVCLAGVSPAPGIVNVFHFCTRHQVDLLNKSLAGQVLDFTNNHRDDRRIWSAALCAKRAVYVYVPPGYDGRTPFPVMLWFHGVGQDEKNFLDIVPEFDRAIRAGCMPPLVIVCPDGSITGRPSLWNGGSFYVNSRAGRFEDYIAQDVWPWVRQTFCVSADRRAHVLAGGSMGGFAAYNLGFKYRQEFGTLVGLLAPLNIRYVDCRGKYFADYDPNCVAFREEARPLMPIARFYGVILVREGRLSRPLVGRDRNAAVDFAKRENPIEMLETYDVRPGEFGMYVGYGGKDEFNADAQAEHFVDVAARRGLALTVQEVPDGNHRTATGVRMLPSLGAFLWREVGPCVPPGCRPLAAGLPVPVVPIAGTK